MKAIRSYIVLGLPALALACGGSANTTPDPAAAATEDLGLGVRSHVVQALKQTNLVSNQTGVAQTTDPNLVNSWGLSFNPTAGLAWISDNGTGLTTVYDANASLHLTVAVPPPNGGAPPSTPTGQVFNADSTAFSGDRFIFVTEDGTVSGWTPADGPSAQLRADNSAAGAVYKGVALAQVQGHLRLYAADFHNGKIDVFDDTYQPVPNPGFVDPRLPPNYAPFNVHPLGDRLLVAYAEQRLPDKHDDNAGAGHGFVDLFSAEGRMLARLISRGALNSPWGMAVAPDGFGHIGGKLLVGNFGDGRINVYDLEHWERWRRHPEFAQLRGIIGDEASQPLVIDGLWAIAFGPDAGGFTSQQLYFTAGPDDEQNGLFGRLELP